jgi:hypothetical protein
MSAFTALLKRAGHRPFVIDGSSTVHIIAGIGAVKYLDIFAASPRGSVWRG